MKPVSPVIPGIKLPEVIYAENQPEYTPLPAYRADDGMVITRWKLSLTERLRIALHGHLWLSVLTFNQPLQPVKLDAVCPNIGVQEGYDAKRD